MRMLLLCAAIALHELWRWERETGNRLRLNHIINLTPLPWERREWLTLLLFGGMAVIGAAAWIWALHP